MLYESNEKIKIYVTKRIADILEKDAESFEFFKADGKKTNKNALLTRLVVNFFDEYREKQEETFEYLKKTIGKETYLGEDRLKQLCYDISEKFNKITAAPDGEKFDQLVSLKPTKESQGIINYISEYMLEGCSLSEYFRNMFSAYTSLPQDRREAIIFKEQRQALLTAIKEKKRVFLTLAHKTEKKMEVAPYALCQSKEELHCYLLAGKEKDSTFPFRLSRITSVTLLAKEATFSDLQVWLFEKMQTYGPQFVYRPTEGEARIYLTEKGKEKFKKIYVHRPIPTQMHDNVYVFHCSHQHLAQYFSRFGKEAYVLFPKHLRKNIENFYREGLNAYAPQDPDYEKEL